MIELTAPPQSFFDCFNTFIINKDRRVFNKLIARTLLYNQVKDVPGDIVECGVFKGTGIYTFLKLKYIFNPNSAKKVVGFDFFDTDRLLATLKGGDYSVMKTLFEQRGFKHDEACDELLRTAILADGFEGHDFELIKGDVSETTAQYAKDNPGFKISLLYMDVDIAEPTYNTLYNLWDNVTKGGIIVFDEYGYNQWSESRGVDRFTKERDLTLHNLNFMCPTAYIQK